MRTLGSTGERGHIDAFKTYAILAYTFVAYQAWKKKSFSAPPNLHHVYFFVPQVQFNGLHGLHGLLCLRGPRRGRRGPRLLQLCGELRVIRGRGDGGRRRRGRSGQPRAGQARPARQQGQRGQLGQQPGMGFDNFEIVRKLSIVVLVQDYGECTPPVEKALAFPR